MRLLVQRSLKSNVSINNEVVGSINHGLVVLVGFTNGDTTFIVDKMIEKLTHLRIFCNEKDLMNLSLLDTKGEILSISQFTLYADTTKGRRPSFINSLNPTDALKLYEYFNNKIKELDIKIECGIFGADMKVNIINDGPVTIFLDSNSL